MRAHMLSPLRWNLLEDTGAWIKSLERLRTPADGNQVLTKPSQIISVMLSAIITSPRQQVQEFFSQNTSQGTG